ncbi:MAG: FAD-dependent oxidoreductase [Oceanococcaceae bacterium]
MARRLPILAFDIARTTLTMTLASTAQTPRPRIAVIGSGIAGLTVAWLLRERYAVDLIEAHPQPGMGAFTVTLQHGGVERVVDVPTRVFCAGYYPHLYALFARIGVTLESTDHAAAYVGPHDALYFQYANRTVGRRSLSYLPWAALRRVEAIPLALAGWRFFRQAARDAQDQRWREHSFAAYLQRRGVSERFVQQVLMPTLCVICTCPPDDVGRYPADLLLNYLSSGVMQQGVVRAAEGIADVVARLTDGVQVHCGTPVQAVRPTAKGVELQRADGRTDTYAQVVLAVQAQQAAAMLDESHAAVPLLRAVRWAASDMVVHTDPDYAPAVSAPVRYRVVEPQAMPEVSVDMARSFPSYRSDSGLFQTWNPQGDPAPDQCLARFSFTRPVVTHASRKAMAALRDRQGGGGLWFAGAYVADRVPLLESAVASALDVAAGLGAPAPWTTASAAVG